MNKLIVRLNPIEKHKPDKNKTFPIAIMAASKKSITPKNINPIPRPISPTPIFWLSSNPIFFLLKK